jgi:hypothetical protein
VQDGVNIEATLRFATALVQDGMTGVTVVVPRAPGVLARARGAAEVAGVSVKANYVGATSISMRFSSLAPAAVPVRLRRRRALFGWPRPR